MLGIIKTVYFLNPKVFDLSQDKFLKSKPSLKKIPAAWVEAAGINCKEKCRMQASPINQEITYYEFLIRR